MQNPPAAPPLELKRSLDAYGASAIVAGTVIGAGIFLVPATIARETGSIAGIFLVWFVGGLLSLAGVLSYAELGAAYPEAGGEYIFLRRAYGPLWGFLFGWQQVAIGKTGSIASIAMAFAIFSGFFFDGVNGAAIGFTLGGTNWTLTVAQAISLVSIVALTALNYLGIAVGGAVQGALTVLKVAAILLLVGLALGSGQGSWSHFLAAPEFSSIAAEHGLGFAAALSAALWAYDGWNNLTMVGAEIRDPDTTIPKVLILGMAAVMLVYMLTNVAYLYVLPLPDVMRTERIAQDVAAVAVGEWAGTAITIAALVSTLAGLNGAIITGARVSYAMAQDGLFFQHMADLSRAHHTPVKALLLQCVVSCALILIMGQDEHGFERLFNYSIFGAWVFYGITALAVIVLRRRYPDLHRPYRTPGYPWTPLVFFAVAAAFCLSMIIDRPYETGLGLAFLAAGLPFYAYWRYFAAARQP